jgi:5-formyltetrahydrofolate cyclo-ligase
MRAEQRKNPLKVILRSEIRKRLAAMDRRQTSDASSRILLRLLETSWWLDASVVLTYLSMEKEVSTDRMIEAAHRAEKKVGVPRLRGKRMEFCPISPNEPEFDVNRLGIREPGKDRHCYSVSDLVDNRVLLIVPGLAFDSMRNRLGRGGGYYDRFIYTLRSHPGISVTALGVFFSIQFADPLPFDPWDERLDVVLTESELLQ